MLVCLMADGKNYPSLLTKNVDRAGLNLLKSLPSQSSDRGLRQIIPPTLFHHSLVVGGNFASL